MATIWSPFCGYNMAYCVELRDKDLSSYLNNIRSDRWFMELSVWSLACPRSVFQRYHSEKHVSEFYPQDGGESQLASKLRHCHPRLVNGSTFSGQFSSVPFICCERALSLAADSTRLNWTVLWRRVRRREFGITNMFIIHREKWRHRSYGHYTIAMLWV